MSQYMERAIRYIEEAETRERREREERDRKRQIIAEKREAYWTTLCDELKADARAWVRARNHVRVLTVNCAGPTIQCVIEGELRVVWVRRGDYCITVGIEDQGSEERKQCLDFDVNPDENVRVKSGGSIFELDQVIETILEPLLFPKGRPR